MSEELYDYVVQVPLTGEYNAAYAGRKQTVVRALNPEQAKAKAALTLGVDANLLIAEPIKRTVLYGE